jgi:exodeoxyribonuclease V alpha subunit
MERAALLLKIAKGTGAKPATVGDAIYHSQRVVLRSREVLLRRIDQAERIVADRLLELAASAPVEPAAEPELPEYLDDSQHAACIGLLQGHVSVLTGGPGTGKTTTLKAALDAIEAEGARILLAAPTGKAAKRMAEVTGRPATTIHKLLGWTPDGWKFNEENPVGADVVVVDETSMVDIELAASLMLGLGDARLIIVGDVDQLPPVGPGQPLQDVIASGAVPVYRLTKTHRQSGESWVVDNAGKIIAGTTPDLNPGGGFEHVACADSESIIGAVLRLYRHDPDVQVLTPEHKKGAGTVALNLAVQRELNPESQDEWADHLKVQGYKIYAGDRVLYTKNSVDLGLVNGDMGRVVEVITRGDNTFAVIDFDGIDNPEHPKGYWELSGSQASPITLAYAMTVHKSQGSEWGHVVVVTDTAHWSLARRLFYTAVTRTSNLLTVVGAEEAITRACESNRNLSRRTLLRERLAPESDPC